MDVYNEFYVEHQSGTFVWLLPRGWLVFGGFVKRGLCSIFVYHLITHIHACTHVQYRHSSFTPEVVVLNHPFVHFSIAYT